MLIMNQEEALEKTNIIALFSKAKTIINDKIQKRDFVDFSFVYECRSGVAQVDYKNQKITFLNDFLRLNEETKIGTLIFLLELGDFSNEADSSFERSVLNLSKQFEVINQLNELKLSLPEYGLTKEQFGFTEILSQKEYYDQLKLKYKTHDELMEVIQ
jgi:hypothetical protein